MSLYNWKEDPNILYDKNILHDKSIQAPYHYIDKDREMFTKSLIKYGITRELIDRIIEDGSFSNDYFGELLNPSYRNFCMDEKYILYKCFAYKRYNYLELILDEETEKNLKSWKWSEVINLLCGINGYDLLTIIKNRFVSFNDELYFIKMLKSCGGDYRKV